MPTIRTRAAKTSALTHNELDANFTRPVTQKTSAYTIVVGDNRSIIEGSHATTAFTLTLPTVANALAAEPGDYEVTCTNINAAIVTVDGNGGELIDGLANLALQQWASATFMLDSAQTGWKAVAKSNCLTHIGALTVSGAFTSLGIDDDATGEVVEITDTSIKYGDASAAEVYSHYMNTTTDGQHNFGGGTGISDGGTILLYGDSHATEAGDIRFWAGNTNAGAWDESSGVWRFYTATGGTKTLALTMDASQDATFAGGITCVSLTETSDPKMKKNSKKMAGAMTKVEKLNGIEFQYIKSDEGGAGLSSADVKAVLPVAVSVIEEKDEDGNVTGSHEGVNYSAVVGLLVEAVKELSAEIQKLKA